MHFFRRKSFQNTTSSKDHYFLPDENQQDNSSEGCPDEQHQNSQPHETVIINNFSENAKIKIDILYDDGIKVEKMQKKIPSHRITQSNLNQISPNRRIAFDNACNQSMGIFQGDSAHPPTPIKTPKYNYKHSFEKITDNVETPMHRFSYHHGYEENRVNGLDEERKNQRYFNTQVSYPFASVLLKSPDPNESRQDNQVKLTNLETPFPAKKLQNVRNDRLRDKRLEISQRLKNRFLFAEPKQKSFYKIPEFNMTQSMNFAAQVVKNHPESDKKIQTITQFGVQKEQKQQELSIRKPFFVREQISDDFLQDKDDLQRKKEGFLSGGKSSGPIESEIAEEVQHGNSFFDQVKSKGEIEDLILPKYHFGKPHEQQMPANIESKQRVSDEQLNQEQLLNSESEKLKSQTYVQRIQLNQRQIFSDQSVKAQKLSNFVAQKKSQHESHSDSYEENIAFENHNQLLETYSAKEKIAQESEQHEAEDDEYKKQKPQEIKDMLSISAGKWNKERSAQSLDVQQYSTRPKTAQVVEIDNQERSIAYPLDETSIKSTQNILPQNNQEELPNKMPTKNTPHSSQLELSQHSINQLSQIQRNSPREDIQETQAKETPQNHQEKPLEEEFYKKYNVQQEQIQSTNKKYPVELKCESVISYSFSPSPKNLKFTNGNQKTPKNAKDLDQASLRLSDKLSLTSSIQISHSRSQSRQTPRTYQELQKYKRLFKKQNKTKNPQTEASNQCQRPRNISKVKYSKLHRPQGYSQRNNLSKNIELIKVEPDNNDEYKVNDTPKSRQKIKSYFTVGSCADQKDEQQRFSNPRNTNLKKQHSGSNLQRGEWMKPNAANVNIKDKRAEDLFTMHKGQFLNKLKRKEKHQTTTSQYRSTSRSTEKQIQTKFILPSSTQNSPSHPHYQSNRSRPLSPYIQNITNRLSSPSPKEHICEHYKKHSRRELRMKFQQLLQQDDNIVLRKYYFSQDEVNQIFVEEILNKEINEIYWVEVLREFGEKKLDMIRLRAKVNFHPIEQNIVRHQQLLADARRTYGDYGHR